MGASQVCTRCAKGKPLIAVVPPLTQQLADVRERVGQELAALGLDEEGQRAQEALTRARAELEGLERRLLERLGLPRNYVRTVRLRLDKELVSWKLWVPHLVAFGLVAAGFFVLPFTAPLLERLSTLEIPLLLVALMLGIVAPHEGLHALGFWLFGRKKPGFKLEFGSFGMGFYAAGNCLLARREYLIVVLLPLLGITALGASLWAGMPDLAPLWYLLIGLNAAGAVGDLWIAGLLLKASPRAFCLDTSYEIAIFEPSEAAKAQTEPASAPGSGSPTR